MVPARLILCEHNLKCYFNCTCSPGIVENTWQAPKA
ncbi:hypothetical protein CJF32_00009800 [Rutstroemia sp. NJR-2017a WRK4]|nr:hypothetical protein CJF32_00009800 [Rutstroemia sp. NJR-2017a WRK4]